MVTVRNWTWFRHSLVNAFGTLIPRHKIDRHWQKKRDFIIDVFRNRMTCEEDVSQYRKEFIYYIDPLVHSRHLTEYEWDVEFWYGFTLAIATSSFHVSSTCTLSSYSMSHSCPKTQVLCCTRRAFAYEGSPRFLSRESQFERLNLGA